jgi:hypothetical protein
LAAVEHTPPLQQKKPIGHSSIRLLLSHWHGRESATVSLCAHEFTDVPAWYATVSHDCVACQQ